MTHRCICHEFGFHVPECFYSDRPGGGQFHCIVCGAEPAWETTKTVDRTMSSSGGTEQVCEVTTRYCENHRPMNARKVVEL